MIEDIRRSREEWRHQCLIILWDDSWGKESLDSPSWVVVSPHHRVVLDRDNVQLLETCEPCWAKELPSLCSKGKKGVWSGEFTENSSIEFLMTLQMNWEGFSASRRCWWRGGAAGPGEDWEVVQSPEKSFTGGGKVRQLNGKKTHPAPEREKSKIEMGGNCFYLVTCTSPDMIHCATLITQG